jgi:hypothetical protein
MNARFASILVAVLLVVGCAQDEKSAESDRYSAPVYRTGSNLPAGRESETQKKDELSPADRRAIEDMQNRPRKPIGVTN